MLKERIGALAASYFVLKFIWLALSIISGIAATSFFARLSFNYYAVGYGIRLPFEGVPIVTDVTSTYMIFMGLVSLLGLVALFVVFYIFRGFSSRLCEPRSQKQSANSSASVAQQLELSEGEDSCENGMPHMLTPFRNNAAVKKTRVFCALIVPFSMVVLIVTIKLGGDESVDLPILFAFVSIAIAFLSDALFGDSSITPTPYGLIILLIFFGWTISVSSNPIRITKILAKTKNGGGHSIMINTDSRAFSGSLVLLSNTTYFIYGSDKQIVEIPKGDVLDVKYPIQSCCRLPEWSEPTIRELLFEGLR